MPQLEFRVFPVKVVRLGNALEAPRARVSGFREAPDDILEGPPVGGG
jgi:hypothetical protein